jgi:hypothetical protein
MLFRVVLAGRDVEIINLAIKIAVPAFARNTELPLDAFTALAVPHARPPVARLTCEGRPLNALTSATPDPR